MQVLGLKHVLTLVRLSVTTFECHIVALVVCKLINLLLLFLVQGTNVIWSLSRLCIHFLISTVLLFDMAFQGRLFLRGP